MFAKIDALRNSQRFTKFFNMQNPSRTVAILYKKESTSSVFMLARIGASFWRTERKVSQAWHKGTYTRASEQVLKHSVTIMISKFNFKNHKMISFFLPYNISSSVFILIFNHFIHYLCPTFSHNAPSPTGLEIFYPPVLNSNHSSTE